MRLFGRRSRFKRLTTNTFGSGYRSGYRSNILRLKLANYTTTGILAFVILAFFGSIFLFLWYSRDLPSPDRVKRHEGFSTVILDKEGKPIYDIFSDKNRILVPLSDIPDHLKQATIAIEDKDFYKHQGFDPKGILRALFNIITLRGFQGGSTLTQQLVKNVLLTSERSVVRKIKEFILAVQIERKYSKDEILQMYLNEAPYAGTMWGIQSAARGYFGKDAKDLTLSEAVVLAGLPQRPSYYSPFGNNPDTFKGRAEEVVRRMREDGYIDAAREYQIKQELTQVKFATPGATSGAAHFVLYVKKLLEEKFGEKRVETGGMKVYTTLDSTLQKVAEKAVSEEIEKVKNLDVSNGAAVALDPTTGAIRAYVGSREYDSQDPEFSGKFDVVSLGLRQPGSALKPITYAVGFAKGYTPATLIMDVETHFPGGEDKPDYIPKNYDGKFRGPVQVRFALGNSINVLAVKMTALVGIRDILKTAYDMGITTLAPTDENENKLGLSLTLGGGEVRLLDLVSAYSVFATGGLKREIYAIEKVQDANGTVLFEHKTTNPKRTISEEVAFLVSHILSDNTARKDVFGERNLLGLPGETVAAKTGTTDDKRDNWTVGFSKSIVVGVWVGNNDNTPMNPRLASGVTGAAPIWNRIIREALKNRDDEPWSKPENVIAVEIDAYGGGISFGDKPKRSEYFIKGTEPSGQSSIYKKIKVSKSDGNKLANAVEVATGNYDEKDFIVFIESDPTSGNENRWQQAIDEWVKKQADSIYHPPTDSSTVSENSVVVRIKKPSDKSKIDGNDVTIEADSKANRGIEKIEIFIDGILKESADSDYIVKTINIATGIHLITVKSTDASGNTGESSITIGVNTDPVPTPTIAPTQTIAPSPTPTP